MGSLGTSGESIASYEAKQALAQNSKPAAIWIVLPTLNESGNVERLLKGIKRELSGFPCCVCVVDGGSLDGTVESVKGFARTEGNSEFSIEVIPQRKLHYGAQRGGAVLLGMSHGLQHAKCDLFVEMDADLAHSPNDLKKGIDAIIVRKYNVAIASKYCRDSRVIGRPAQRRVMSFIYNSLLRTFLSHKVRDFSNGYRFYDLEATKLMCLRRIRYTSAVYLVDVLASLIEAGMKVTEFPSTYEERLKGASKITIIDYFKAGLGASEITVRYWVSMARKRNHKNGTAI